MTAGNADTFSNAFQELRWRNDFRITAVAENQAFKLTSSGIAVIGEEYCRYSLFDVILQ